MKNLLKNSFKATPERFRYTVASAVAEAKHSDAVLPEKRKLSKPARMIIAAALIIAMIPAAVFGASKLIGLFARPVDKYGVEIGVETVNSAYPEYVKMHVAVPEGFIVEPDTDDLKYTEYAKGGNFDSGAFSLCPMRPKNSSDVEVIKNVKDYEEVTLCGHTAYRIRQLDSSAFERVYVSYPEVNILLLVWYYNVTEEQLENFIGGVSFTEGTAAVHTELWEMFDERIEDKVVYTYGYDNIELDRDTVMTFAGFSERNNDESIRYTAQITGVTVTDNVNNLNDVRTERAYNADFITGRNSLYDIEELTDEDGNLLPRTMTVKKYGDGFNTADEIISETEMEQSLILIDITYTNLSDEDVIVNMPYDLEVFNKGDNGSLTPAQDIDPANKIFAYNYCDREMMYNSDPLDTVKMFYCTELGANATKTVTIGYRCSTDMLDKAYLAIIDATSFGIVDPAPAGYENSDRIPNYIIKVQ